MNKKDTSYRMPEGFNPYTALDAVRGLTDAIHQFLLEGPGTQRVIPDGDRAGLNALVEFLHTEMQALHEYFAELENRGLVDLPRSEAEMEALERGGNEVREPAAIYAIQ